MCSDGCFRRNVVVGVRNDADVVLSVYINEHNTFSHFAFYLSPNALEVETGENGFCVNGLGICTCKLFKCSKSSYFDRFIDGFFIFTFADLSRNRFCELPDDVTGFPFLETLLMYHNTLRSIPETIRGLHSLSFLDLR